MNVRYVAMGVGLMLVSSTGFGEHLLLKQLEEGKVEYLGFQRNAATFETCEGYEISIDKSSGDEVKKTPRRCPDDEGGGIEFGTDEAGGTDEMPVEDPPPGD